MTQKIIIKLTIAENSDGISSETARWLQGNRHQAIAAIQDSCKPEIIAYSKASDREIDTARLEALAYHEYRAKVLRAQLYGHIDNHHCQRSTIAMTIRFNCRPSSHLQLPITFGTAKLNVPRRLTAVTVDRHQTYSTIYDYR